MATLPRRTVAVSILVSTILAAIVIGLLQSPDPRHSAHPSADEAVAAATVAEGAITEVASSEPPALAVANSGEDASAHASASEASFVRPTGPESVAASLPASGAGLSVAAHASVSGLRIIDNGDAAIAAGLAPNVELEMDSNLDDEDVLMACASADGPDVGCPILDLEPMESGFATLYDQDGIYAMDGHDQNLFVDGLASSIEDESFVAFDPDQLGENLTPFLDEDLLGAGPRTNDGEGAADQPNPLLGSIGGPQSPGSLPPASGPIPGQPLDRGAGSPPGGTEGTAPGGSGVSASGPTGSGSGVPEATRLGGSGVPRTDQPNRSSPPSRMALPVEINAANDPWSSGPSPAQTPELGSLALFGTGAASMAGYVLVRVRAGRGRRK
jgi:hypothetical protein